MNQKIVFLLMTCLLISCSSPEVQRIRYRLLGTGTPVTKFNEIKSGMTMQEVFKIVGEEPKSFLSIGDGTNLQQFTDGFLVEKAGAVVQANPYPEIKEEDTLNSLVSLADPIIEIFKKAGWPLKITNEGSSHVLFYRTGTLLLKDLELINTFNRNQEYHVSVSAYKGSEIKQPIYYIVPSVLGIDRNSLEFIEVKKYVEHIIILSKGKVTENLKDANVYLFVNFGVGDKNIDILTYSRPVYQTVYNPGHSSTTQVQNQFGQNLGSIQTSSPGTFSSQYAGQSTSQYKIETYRRHLMLEAINASSFKQNGEKSYYWKIITESHGTTGDFRAILPVLSFGASGYVYKNSGKSVDIRIDFDQMMNFFLKVYAD